MTRREWAVKLYRVATDAHITRTMEEILTDLEQLVGDLQWEAIRPTGEMK